MGLCCLELLFLEDLEEGVLEGVFFAEAFGVRRCGGVAEVDLVLPSAIFGEPIFFFVVAVISLEEVFESLARVGGVGCGWI